MKLSFFIFCCLVSSFHPADELRGLSLIDRPLSEEEAGPISIAPESVCIVSHYSDEMRDYAELTVENHREYAALNGYQYKVYSNRISGENFSDPTETSPIRRDGLYWQKVAALESCVRENKSCRWLMWVDADVVFTHLQFPVTEVIKRHGWVWSGDRLQEKHLIMPVDQSELVPEIKINNGVFILKNSPWGKKFLCDIRELYDLYKNNPTPEQDAMQDYIHQELAQTASLALNRKSKKCRLSKVLPEVVLSPQREMNSFIRLPLDRPEACWSKCDFIAHLTGLDRLSRVSIVRGLMEELRTSSCVGEMEASELK
jgi:hypothetical protein